MAQSIEFQLGEEIIELRERNAKLVAALGAAAQMLDPRDSKVSAVRKQIAEALRQNRSET